MKIIYFFLLSLFINETAAQSGYLKQLLIKGYSDARGVVCADDQSFIITGLDKTDSDSFGDMYAMKIDNSGVIQWTKHYGLKKEDGGNHILKLSDNNFLITGHSDSHNDECDGYLIKIGENGDKIWSILLGDSLLDDVLYSSVEDIDGNIYSVGRTESFGSLKYDFYLTKVSANGVLIYQKHFGSALNEIGESIAFTSDGNILMVGYSYDNDNNMGDFFMVNCSKDGVENWRKNTVNIGNDILHKTIRINNYMGIFGQKYDALMGLQSYIAIIDNSGNILNESSIGFKGDDIILSAVLSKNEIINCLGYTTSYQDSSGDAAILKFDLKCNLKSINFFGTKAFDQCRELVFQSDGSCIMAGKSGTKAEKMSTLIIKTDASGLLKTDEVEKNNYKLYPNPVNNLLNIEIKSESIFESSINIFNIEGKCVLKSKLIMPNNSIDMSDLPKGIYVVKIFVKDIAVYRQLILKEN